MLSRSQMILLAASTVLSGCTVGPDYAPPTIALPNHYQAQTAAMPLADHALDTWWARFEDPLLTRLVEMALAQNLDIEQANARIVQARAGLTAARAALLPVGNVSGQAGRAYQSLETSLGRIMQATSGDDRSGSSYELNLDASWELDVFGGLRRGREAAHADYQATAAGARAVRLAVSAQTADLYVDIRGLQARLAIARHQVETQRGLLSMVKLLNDKGLATERELHQTEGGLAEVQASVPALQYSLDLALNALDVLLAQPPGTYRVQLAKVEPIPKAPHIESTGSPADLLRRRPDLIAAERRLAAANARIGEAIAEYYPKLSLSALIGSATTISSSNLFSHDANQALGGVGLSWRLFDFGRIDAQIQAAKGRDAELLAAYRLAVLRATEDVEGALTGQLRREEQVTILTSGEASLTQARQASALAYQKGVVTLVEVLQADDRLLRTADARAQAQTAAAQAAVATFKALGGGWQSSVTAHLVSTD
ncbi:efflux transporter outer membrane subunit [Pseudomonas sp. CBMAI 2609]|uniref:Efflux transporter outer membrane subunit n=1 Tax=Pseudomonas flavocrustae TaxID=2991719 RepID=A0ABT6II83_9PSED|nr:efflux transporter outer membrane subunit [Pseudomonas sp. CBMAI 2609]MDH4764166.1 efflux transporter outer membrane subunit [Pseudomonas sp. CBMAI 2609]